MKTNLTTTHSSALARLIHSAFTAALLPTLLFLLTPQPSQASSATWKTNPSDGDWNFVNNWTPVTVPNGPSDTATFATSAMTAVSLSANTEVNGIIFNAGASPYTITSGGVTFTISGLGIDNNSGMTQKVVTGANPSGNGTIYFLNSATAGSSTLFTIGGTQSTGYKGVLNFSGNSSAGNCSFVLEGSAKAEQYGAEAYLSAGATADSASFTLNGGTVTGAYGALMSYTSYVPAPVAANFTVNGGAVASTFGAYMSFYPAIAGDLTSNFTVGGGAATSAFGGRLYFQPYNVANVNGNFTIGGGSATSATGAYLSFSPLPGTSVNGSLTVKGGTASGAQGGYVFIISSGALTGAGNFTINGGTVSGALGGYMELHNFDMGDHTYTVNGGRGSSATGGALYFYFTPGASGTLIANGGTNQGGGGAIYIYSGTSGGIPRIKVFGNGSFDMSGWYSGSAAAGSIEGSGLISLGSYNLSVGSNNLSTTFSGVLQDLGLYSSGPGSLTKIGAGTLTLSGANTYTGGTTVSAGTLLVSNTRGSGTGSGTVTVNTSILGGTGIISGAVTVGSNSGPGAFLAPGNAGIGTLTIRRTLRLNRNATYNCELDSNTTTADKVVARGVTINTAAVVILSDIGTGMLPLGTVFTVIDNTATSAIAGTFSNLPNGSTFTLGSNSYQASYTGGTGNDLTLTVQ